MSKRTRRERNRLKRENQKRSKDALKLWQKEKGIFEFAEKLKSDIPKSEQWFLELFAKENLGIYLKNNQVLDYFIPDFIYKTLIIEIDDPTHLRPDRQTQDRLKNAYYDKLGYELVRIKAWDIESYKIGIAKVKNYIVNQKKKREEEERKQWLKNKQREGLNKKRGKKGKNLRTRELTEWEQRRQDYIKKRKSML